MTAYIRWSLWAVALGGVACGPQTLCGLGTRLAGDQCIVDTPDAGGADAGARDAGPLEPPDAGADGGSRLRDGDALLVTGELTVGAGLLQCLEGTVLHRDGTREPAVGTFSVELDNLAVATPAEAGDCPGFGVLGGSPGQTLARVALTQGPTTLRAQLGVTVPTHTLRLLGLSATGYLQVVGDRRQRTTEGHQLWSAAGMQVGGSFGVLVPRWVGFEFSPPSSARATAVRFPSLMLVGDQAGTTNVTATYQPPGRAALRSAPSAVRFFDPAALTFQSLTSVSLVDAEGFAVSTSRSGSCGTPTLLAWFTAGATRVSGLISDATWSASGAGLTLTAGSPPRVCVAVPGEEGVLTGCRQGECAALQVVVDDPSVTQLTLTRESQATARLDALARLCLPMTLTHSSADKAPQDITARAGVRWELKAYTGEPPSPDTLAPNLVFSRAMPGSDAQGRPCFEVFQPVDTQTIQYTVAVTAQYGGLQATQTLQYLR